MDTFEDLIAQWPTVREFAEDMGVSPNTAAGWKRRKSIPADYWEDLLAAAARRKMRIAAGDLVKFASHAA